ncbi:unnamed protein product, partial [Adineta ricciae]
PADNSSGIQGVNFEGIIDEQHDTSKQDSISDSETTDNALSTLTKSNCNRQHENVNSRTRLPESFNISFESGYDSNQLRQRFHSSSSMSSIERKSSATSNRSRPSSGSGPISIPNSRLRPTDPVTQLLEVVHKIVYISCFLPTSSTDKQRRLVDRYCRYLFSRSSSHNLKGELIKLSHHSNDPIEIDSLAGRRTLNFHSLTKSSSSNTVSNLKTDITIPENDGAITYEQMMSYVDEILSETDYSKETMMSVSSAGECLPPTVQKIHRPPRQKR